MEKIKYLPLMAYKHTASIHHGYEYDLKISPDHPIFDDGDKVFVWIPPLTGIEQMVELTCRTDDSVTPDISVCISEHVRDLLTGYTDKGDIRIEVLQSHNVFCWNKYHDLLPQYEKDLDAFYPLCVLKDRYGGAYSGGIWTAWVNGIDYIPDGVFSDDVECMTTWRKLQEERKEGKAIYGVGNTPEEALRDIVRAYKFRLSLFEKKDEDEEDDE
ncbi:MAG: hypothetical protein IKA36_03170 [Clostridia bacterium]|nr:hypothetical protein [Clostridia bacterium]